MKYDSLLLNHGGGITFRKAQSPQSSGTAALCIGIGGAGIKALSRLRGMVYRDLIPDHSVNDLPDPVPYSYRKQNPYF